MARTGTIHAKISEFNAITRTIEPPAHCTLRDGDQPFWDAIIKSKPADQWTPSDLEIAVHLARCRADIERLQTQANQESEIITNIQGNVLVNPKYRLIMDLIGRQLRLATAIQVHTIATQGLVEAQPKKAQAYRETKALVNTLKTHNPLIAVSTPDDDAA